MTLKELHSQIQVEIGFLVESDIDQLDPILRAHVRNRDNHELIPEEVETIKGWGLTS